jgi:HSP20 family protein
MLPVRVFQNCVNDMYSNPLAAWSRLPGLFNEMLGDTTSPTTGGALPVNIRQDGDKWTIEAEVPGLKKEDVNISVENDVLTIGGKYASEATTENAEYHLRERRTGEFSRSFRLPKTADSEKVTAELANGVLTLSIPTREEAKPRRIELK